MNRYETELAKLSSKHPGRNKELVRLAMMGILAGRTSETLHAEIISAGGDPRLEDAEVDRAIETASRYLKKPSPWKPTYREKREKSTKPTEKQQNFVRWMISEGGEHATFDALKSISAGTDFFSRVLKQDKLYFFGNKYDKRTRKSLMTPPEFLAKTRSGMAMPPLFTPNPFTGEKGLNDRGEASYCLDSLISERTLALIEFDELAIDEQAAFWLGVIRKGMLSVASLVFSGHKSIHGLIRLKPTDWAGQWQTIERLMASDDDRKYRCDIACKNAGRMTRLPGAINPSCGNIQELLYLG